MRKLLAKKKHNEKGQAILLVVVAMGVFLVGALGLAIDGANLYGHRSMAQAAADAAAQAAILSMFNATNVGTNLFADTSGYTHTCTTTDVITPCRHARTNGFGGTANDVVFIDIPSTPASVGLDPASLTGAPDPVKLIRVTVTRHVGSSLIRMLGAANTVDVSAVAVAAIVGVESAVPILVTHPTLAQSLSTNGSTTITICGGPNKSIQVNSNNVGALNAGGAIHLENAGPADTGNCVAGTGADLGVFGGPTTKPGSVTVGSTGNYVSPSSRIKDPLASVAAPSAVGLPAGSTTLIHSPTDGCAYANCTEYSPGIYTEIDGTGGNPVIFRPGLYYIRGSGKGFTMKNVDGGGGVLNGYNALCTTCPADANTGTGMVVYDTGPAGSTLNSNPSGGFTIDTNTNMSLRGATLTTLNSLGQSVPAGPYYGVLFWEDAIANAHTGNAAHTLGKGNSNLTLIGTIYITNSDSVMGTASHYQEVDFNGNPGSTTRVQGDIIVSALQIVGNVSVTMNLVPYGFLTIRQVALVR